jgi:phosphomannomutase/phosphoglucomutase
MSIYIACDIRGRFGTELTVQHAERLAVALTHLYPRGPILVGGDGRLSTPVLKDTLIQTLLRLGWNVVDLGRVSTPLFYFARKSLELDMGIMVTASHNPAHDNGFKLTLGALPVTDEDVALVAEVMESSLSLEHHPNGSIQQLDMVNDYVKFLYTLAPDLTGLKVVVDCSNGMGGQAARRVWEKTGAEVTCLLEEVDGHFSSHAPNPADAKNLALLSQAVIKQTAHLGIAFDGDADRVAFVDENGKMVSSDAVIVLYIRDMLRGGKQTIVFDQKCSRIVPETIRQLGGTPVMERSGHTYIKRAYMKLNAIYAGELSGHHFLRAAGGDDGIASSLFFARLLKESNQPLSQLVAGIPTYAITPDLRIPMSAENIQCLIIDLKRALGAEASLNTLDGLRVEFPDGWGLVRASVTEPVLTLRFEGVNERALHRIQSRFEAGSSLLKGMLLKHSGGNPS